METESTFAIIKHSHLQDQERYLWDLSESGFVDITNAESDVLERTDWRLLPDGILYPIGISNHPGAIIHGSSRRMFRGWRPVDPELKPAW